MASVASQLIEKVTTHGQRDSLEDAREICADGTYFPNNLRTNKRDGATLQDRVPGLRVRVPNASSANVSGSDIPELS